MGRWAAHCTPCLCSCGIYPSTKFVSAQNTLPSATAVSAEDEHCCYVWTHSLDAATSRVLSCLACPTRACGRACGHSCRNLCPTVQESFNGPPEGCTVERVAFEVGGGLGNCYTHVFKGSFKAMTSCRRRIVWAWCDCCGGDPGSIAAANACGSVCVNACYAYLLGWEDVLIIGPAAECLDHCINTDVYLQGPVLMQGPLRVTGSCFDGFDRGWVVLRPWSIAVYASPDDFHPGRASILLPTCNIFDCSPATETPGVMELRTLDFSRYRFHGCEAEGANDSDSPSVEQWRVAIKAAIKRVETIAAWDQGASEAVREHREIEAAAAATSDVQREAQDGGGAPRVQV